MYTKWSYDPRSYEHNPSECVISFKDVNIMLHGRTKNGFYRVV